MGWAVIQHVPHEGPGLVAEVAAQRGLSLRIYRMDDGEPLPRVAEIDGLIVMGGPMAAFDDQKHPHLAQERQMLSDCLAEGRPVLGICLGAQLLAATAGGHVWPGPSQELGVGPVTATSAGRSDPVFSVAGPAFPAFHWHRDTFSLPAGGVNLASTPAYQHQALRLGRAQYGLQFHVELTGELVAGMAPHLPPEAMPSADQIERIAAIGHNLLNRFLHLATAS